MTVTRDSGSAGEARSTIGHLKDAMFTGVALTIPLAITLFLLLFVVSFLTSTLEPLVGSLADVLGMGTNVEIFALYLLTIGTLLVLLLVIGLAAETRLGRRIEGTVNAGIERIPGIGSVYGSFNEMSELLLDSDSQSFREVVLVEFPMQGSYSVAFITSDTPEFVLDSTGHDGMQTVFMPMAPNPVMGGFVLYVSEERIHEVDMSVEDGIQAIVTSGVAVGNAEGGPIPEGPEDDSTSTSDRTEAT